jgi:hypothetical protein
MMERMESLNLLPDAPQRLIEMQGTLISKSIKMM